MQSKTSIDLFLSLTIAVVACLFFNPLEVMNIFILLGLGHVTIAFWYMYSSPKTSFQKKALIPITILSFLGISYYIENNIEYAILYILLSFAFFCAHFFWDELELVYKHIRKYYLFGLLSTISSFTALYISKYYSWISAEFIITGFIISLISLVIFTYFFCNDNTIEEKMHGTVFASACFMFPFLIYVFKLNISFLYVAGIVIISHYIRWYIFYYRKTKQINNDVFKKYIITSLVINIFFFFLFYLYINHITGPLKYLFHPLHFYAIANAHVLVSLLKKV